MRLSASLYAADPLHLADAVDAVAPHVGSLHVDVMDGRFAPAFGFGEKLVRRLVAEAAPPIDVHLMIDEPERWSIRFAAMGVRSVAFHREGTSDPATLAAAIRREGARAYVALAPETDLATIAPIMSAIDGILLLTAPPGGGAFVEASLQRLAQVPPGMPIIVDGKVGPRHFDVLRTHGVELAVVGAALFDGGRWAERARELDRLATGDVSALAEE